MAGRIWSPWRRSNTSPTPYLKQNNNDDDDDDDHKDDHNADHNNDNDDHNDDNDDHNDDNDDDDDDECDSDHDDDIECDSDHDTKNDDEMNYKYVYTINTIGKLTGSPVRLLGHLWIAKNKKRGCGGGIFFTYFFTMSESPDSAYVHLHQYLLGLHETNMFISFKNEILKK